MRYYKQALHDQLRELSTDADATILARARRIPQLTVKIPAVRPLPKGCFLLKASSELSPQDIEVQAVVDESQQFLESLLIPLLQEGQQTGELQNFLPPRAQAHFMNSILVGLHVIRQLYADSSRVDDAIEVALLALAKESGMTSPVGDTGSTMP